MKRKTKRYQKGGISAGKILATLGLGAAALSGMPGASARELPNPTSTGLMSYGGPGYTGSPSYSTSLATMDTPYSGQVTAQPTYRFTGPNSFVSSSTNFAGPLSVQMMPSATPSYITPPAMPGAVASVVQPVHKILQNTGVDYLKGRLGTITEDMVVEATAPKKMSEGIVIAGHNTLTSSTTRVPVVGTPLVSVNQILSLDQYLDRCAVTGRCFLDLDMWMLDGQVKSTHGGPMRLGTVAFEKLLNTSEGSRGTQPVLQKIHAFAKAHPSTTFMIRSENHNVSAKDIESMLTPEMKSQVATFSKFEVPTHGELTGRGTNIMYFLENSDQALVDQSTGIYEDSVVMAQDHFFVRTNWDDIKGLTSGEDIHSHLIYDPAKLGSSPFFLVDGYNTLIAANTSADAFEAQTRFVSKITTDLLPRMKQDAKAHGVDNVDDAGVIVMMDFVNDGAFAYQVAENLKETIQDPEVRTMVEQEIIPAFIRTQEMIAPTVTGAAQRGIGNSFYAVYKGKSVSATNVAHISGTIGAVGSFIGGVSLVVYYFLFGRKKKLAEKAGEKELAEKIDIVIQSDIAENPEIAPFVKKGEESVKESDTSLMNGDPSAIQSIFTPNASASNEPTTPGVSSYGWGNSVNPWGNWGQVYKGGRKTRKNRGRRR